MSKVLLFFTALCLLLLSSFLPPLFAQTPPPVPARAELQSLNPQGAVKQVQQVTVRFSTEMIAMGDPRSMVDPLKMECTGGDQKTLAHKSRWADNRNWVVDFDSPLPSGVRCTLRPARNLKDLAGAEVKALDQYSFSTAGPALLGLAPTYGGIEPQQYFVGLADGPLDLKSIAATAYFEVEHNPAKIGARIITGNERDEVIAAAIKDNWRWQSYQKLLKRNKSLKGSQAIRQTKEFESFFVVASELRFPEKARVVFHWPVGILSMSGLPVQEPQQFEFNVIEPFSAKFSCERTAADRPCNPILNTSIQLTARVPLKTLKGTKLIAADGRTWTPVELNDGDQNKNVATTVPNTNVGVAVIANFEDKQVDTLTFKAPFPENTKFRVELPKDIRDELGRPLTNQSAFPLQTATDEYSPLLKFSARFGILEAKADPILPVSVRNLESNLSAQQMNFEGQSLNVKSSPEIIKWIKRLQTVSEYGDRRNQSVFQTNEGTKFQLPKSGGQREFELMGIPLKKPGFYVIELSSPKLGAALTESKAPMYVPTSALVTNMAVHMKIGRESSVVWVTELSTGKPVADAQVALYGPGERELANGRTDRNGLMKLGREAAPCPNPEDQVHRDGCDVWAVSKKGDDLSLASSDWSQGIESYRFNVSNEYLSREWGPHVMHTVLDRMAVQKGERVNMKHVLRSHTGQGFAMMNPKYLPKRVLVVHSGSQKTYTLPFKFDPVSGTADGTFTVPEDATLGTYSIYLSNKVEVAKQTAGDDDPFDYSAVHTADFTVAEYRLPLMKATVKIQGDSFNASLIQPADAKADLSASYLSGGPAGNLKVKARSSLQPGYFSPGIEGDYRFYDTPMKAGVSHWGDDDEDRRDDVAGEFLKVQELTLNKDGGALVSFGALPPSPVIRMLTVEMEYVDPNGEYKTASSRATVFPGDLAVGIRTESWASQPDKAKVSGIIVNTLGKREAGKKYFVEAFRRTFLTHRKRLVGGFYSYDSKTEIKALGKICEGVTDKQAEFSCELKSLPPGEYTIQARVVDDRGRVVYGKTGVSLYAPSNDQWWTPSDSDRIDLLPTQKRFEPGEKAKFVVRMPFEKASALVTVEREGVLDSYVMDVNRDNPILEIPMKGSYAPNVFVSALLVRGRIAGPQPTALLDLARPSMKMGLANIKVGWRDHEVLVAVKTDKPKYQTREPVEVTVQLKTANGTPLAPNTEVALAAVDEALMRLRDNTSFDLLTSMMDERPLAVSTSSGQNQVVGRRHFGSKAKPVGGGGGTGPQARELFDPILSWQPHLKADAEGRVRARLTLNDSITSFRIVAVANSGTQMFGSGSTTIESTKDLILYSGFSPLVREGDQIQNAFTVRNTTAKPMKVAVEIVSKEISKLPKIDGFELKPSEARTLSVPMTVPIGFKSVSFELRAHDTLSKAADAAIAKVKVEEAVPDRVLQATLFQLDRSNQISVRQPADSIPNKGSLNVTAKASLVHGLTGVRSYMGDYPYTCLEQKVSKAITLEDQALLSKAVTDFPSYMDGQGFLKFFPVSICGSPQLTRYVLSILAANGTELPSETRSRLIDAMKTYVSGGFSCRSWWDDLVRNPFESEARLLAMETLSRYKAFDAGALSTLKITPNLWKTETVAAWFRLLKREPTIANRDAELQKARTILQTRVNFQGSLMNLQGDFDWEAQMQLFSSRDQEAMGVFGLYSEEPAWAQDAGRMARGVVARLKKGHWDTTMANAWGVVQFRRFSERFEKEKISGQTKITAAAEGSVIDWAKTPKGETKKLEWPKDSRTKDIAVQFRQDGSGKPWIHFETRSAIPLKAPWDMGYKITRKVTPVSQAKPGSWKVGDVANIELTVTAKADQAWVVIRDPLPAGAAALGNGLDGSSTILDRSNLKRNSGQTQPWPTEYDEKSFASFTSYAAYLPRGTYNVNYRVRLNSAGTFKLPPTHVEAMYAPETFGDLPNADWVVTP